MSNSALLNGSTVTSSLSYLKHHHTISPEILTGNNTIVAMWRTLWNENDQKTFKSVHVLFLIQKHRSKGPTDSRNGD